MARNCEHDGFHSGVGKLSQDFEAIRFVTVCDTCGEEMSEVHIEPYAPQYDPAGNQRTGPGRAAA